ncbi:unnamed protein product, partial [Ectocarpus sp. 12 AP-2014]
MPVVAVTLAECDRTIYVSHGGESQHRDLGAGRVSYVEWWSQEGVYTDVVLANCESGTFLRTRVREERISSRSPFDVGKKATGLIEVELTASPALFSFERLASALKGTSRDIEIAQLETEPCACAAQYPELLGSKTPFED